MHTNDFGYHHFILIKAPYALVLDALKTETTGAGAASHGVEIGPWKPGLLTRLLLLLPPFRKPYKRGLQIQQAMQELPDTETTPYAVTSGPDAQTPPLLTIDDMATLHAGSDASFDDIRLRSIEASDWVLVEYKEQASGMSMLGFSLSMALPDFDVLYFCRSGNLALEKRYDFHVYQNGATLRRVLCHSSLPNVPDAPEWWEGILDGDLTAYEATDLYADTTEETVLSNAKIDTILAKARLSLDTMFARSADTVFF